MQSVTVRQVCAFLEKWAPLSLAESWDNVGLLVEAPRPVTRILTALDITPAVVEEAVTLGAELIVSHHPVIFYGVKKLHYNNVLYRLAQNGISAVCMHTNLDCAEGGTGDVLAELLGLQGVHPFTAEENSALGRLGVLPGPLQPVELAQLCKKVLNVPVRYVDGGRRVEQVAVITGAGDCIADALNAGAQALVTGEVGYHKALEALEAGLTVVEAGHFGTEIPIAQVLASRLSQAFPQLQVDASTRQSDPFVGLP